MDFKTKYNIGDKLFTYDIHTGKLNEFNVFMITIIVKEEFAHIYYNDGKENYKEDVCFKTRKEFIDNL